MIDSAFRVAQQTADRLVILAPGSSLLAGWMSLAIGCPMLLIFYFASRSISRVYSQEKTPAELATLMLRYRLSGLAVFLLFFGFFWAVSYTSGSIELDRTANLATMRSRMTIVLPERSVSVPLSSVREAWLDTKPNARRIRLLVHHGADLAYPVWSDRPGQDASVAAINKFLTDQQGASH